MESLMMWRIELIGERLKNQKASVNTYIVGVLLEHHYMPCGILHWRHWWMERLKSENESKQENTY